MPVYNIFPEPVYFSKLKRALTKEELKTINFYKEKTHKNEGNVVSNDAYVLENKSFKNLKKDLNKIIRDYFNEIVCTSDSIIPYVTQSWLNYTSINQYHHKHNHSNSYLSGIFYIDADKTVDKVTFHKPHSAGIVLEVDTFNTFNSKSWWFPVETGDVVLFPSSVSHGVDKKKGTNTRISLAFNVFFKGTIGSNKGLTELVLE